MSKKTSDHKFNTPPQSYWLSSVSFDDYPPLEDDINVDVAIVGGGIVGITTAFMLSQNGLKVALVEANKLLHGTTGHTTAKVTAQHDIIYSTIESKLGFEKALQHADANRAAIMAIASLVNELNIDCDFISQPAYVYTQKFDYIQKIQDEAELAKKLGFSAVLLEDIPLPINVKAALRFDNQYQFHPTKYLLALVDQLVNSGNCIFEHTRAIDINTENKNAIVTVDGFSIMAPNIVIASHYPFYDGNGMYFARAYPDRSYALGLTIEENYPGGMYITAEDPARSFRSQPMENGEELIIVGGDHHKTGQSQDTATHYKNLLQTANETFTVKDIPYRWSAQDYTTMDEVPYIGNLTSKTSGIYVATGFRKWGMTSGTTAALVLKDLVLAEDNPWSDLYSPSRFTPIVSAGKFIAENANVASQLIKGKLSKAEMTNILPGEASIIEIDGKKYGAYRDMQKELFVVDTKCTHMGCELAWNTAEHTWDCPCHGSRFTYTGQVIEGPAQKPLSRPDLDEE
ncbi:MAG TPA: FAD-dependent oxidoreductase [Bacillota bacterium]|nr:FAD-dependent oxidoreductase [Bacillota bacterium]